MLKKWRKIDTLDGFEIVFAPCLEKFYSVRVLHLEMIQRSLALEDLEIYYQKLCTLIGLEFEKILPQSKELFFHSEQGGLSGLELIMGYEINNHNQSNSELKVTTGDFVLDLYAELFLTFGAMAMEIANKFSPQEIGLLIVQANRRLRGDESLKEIQRERDLVALEKNREELEIKLTQETGFRF